MKQVILRFALLTAMIFALAQDTVHFTEFQKDTDIYYQPYQYEDYVATTQGWFADKVVNLLWTGVNADQMYSSCPGTKRRTLTKQPNSKPMTVYGIAAAIVPNPGVTYGVCLAVSAYDGENESSDTLRIVDSVVELYQTRYYHVAVPARATPNLTWNQSCDSTVVGSYDTSLLCYEFYFQHPIRVNKDFYIGVFQREVKPSAVNLNTWAQKLCIGGPDYWVYETTAYTYRPGASITHWEEHQSGWNSRPLVMAIVSPPDEDIPNCGSVAGLQAEASDTGQVALEWEPVPCASGYQVAYGTANPPMDTVVTTNATSLQINGLLQGSLLYARVRAICHYTSPFTDTTYYGPWSDDVYFEIPMWQDTSDTTGIALASGNDSRITLHPNPTRDRLTAERDNAIPATLEVFNAKGQKVMAMASDQAVVTIDVSSLAAGSYLLRVTTAEGSSVRTFVIKR